MATPSDRPQPGSLTEPVLRLILILALLFPATALCAQPRRTSEGAVWENGTSGAPAALESIQSHAAPMLFATFGEDDLLQPSVILEIQRQLSPSYLKGHAGAQARSAIYRDFIAVQLQARRLPPDLITVAYIESAFHIRAESRTGARGLWQFAENSMAPWLASSSEGFAWDERFDFWKSTLAALDKLQSNYRGTESWVYAVAAYNGGLGRMQRALDVSIADSASGPAASAPVTSGEAGGTGFQTALSSPAANSAPVNSVGERSFWKLDISDRGISDEMAAYVPRYIANSIIALYPGRLGLDMSWADSFNWERSPVSLGLSLETFARDSGIPLGLLQAGNAEYLEGYIPEGEHWLKYPSRYQSAVRETLPEFSKGEFHLVQPGDTLWSLSRRYSVSLDDLRSLNDMSPADQLKVGVYLRIKDGNADK